MDSINPEIQSIYLRFSSNIDIMDRTTKLPCKSRVSRIGASCEFPPFSSSFVDPTQKSDYENKEGGAEWLWIKCMQICKGKDGEYMWIPTYQHSCDRINILEN